MSIIQVKEIDDINGSVELWSKVLDRVPRNYSKILEYKTEEIKPISQTNSKERQYSQNREYRQKKVQKKV